MVSNWKTIKLKWKWKYFCLLNVVLGAVLWRALGVILIANFSSFKFKGFYTCIVIILCSVWKCTAFHNIRACVGDLPVFRDDFGCPSLTLNKSILHLIWKIILAVPKRRHNKLSSHISPHVSQPWVPVPPKLIAFCRLFPLVYISL